MARFSFDSNPAAVVHNVFQCGEIRVSVLTERLIRIEKGSFTDEATQTVWNRDFEPVEFYKECSEREVEVKTSSCTFTIDSLTAELKSVRMGERIVSGDFDKGNLMGTARTLDMAKGAVRLDKGLMSRNGVSLMDDSKSLILRQDGKIYPREKCRDIYVFAYGNDYRTCLKDFFRLTGAAPLIPKYALGNWWSRYKAYSQDEYKALMEMFAEKEIPVTVATIDMDWHWTDVIKRFGKKAAPAKAKNAQELFYGVMNPGWTGYSWNTELFPDRKALLDWLHENNYAVALNVHPSQGVRFFEEAYPRLCERLGVDPSAEKAVEFDLGNMDFAEAYFDLLHHPYEEEGIDLWWIDWQQGKRSNMKGLDPLWALNHYHSLDAARNGKRPLILSRYAGMGSHRYPLGFSGDSVCAWESLDFQPYFTANAANAGYTWWSHDIGGHCLGVQDDELYVRWIQFGVFSPINRLHSTNNECMGKEPWKRSFAAREAAMKMMRLRHKLIPYLYSMNYLTHVEGRALCEPMYYSYDCREAYEAKNQYFFGTELMVCPITKPGDKAILMGSSEVWLPEGRWTDIFTGRIYEGGQHITMYRDIDALPVLAKEGCILPLYSADKRNSLSNSQALDINIWRGNNLYFHYEDDGTSLAYKDGHYSLIPMEVSHEGDTLYFRVGAYKGEKAADREINIIFRDIVSADIELNGEKVHFGKISIPYTGRELELKLTNCVYAENPPLKESIIELFTGMQGDNVIKNVRLKKLLKDNSYKKHLPKEIKGAVEELLKMKY